MREGYLYLADGRKFAGRLYGEHSKPAEVVFTTAMTGYEEAYTDPSYMDQILTWTYPLVGNYGTSLKIRQGERPAVSGVIMSELCEVPNNWESEGTLGAFLRDYHIPCLAGADTRAIARAIREEGTPRGILAAAEEEAHVAEWLAAPAAHDQILRVTTKEIYAVGEGAHRVTVVDCGVKRHMLELLAAQDCRVTVVPATATAQEIMATEPDGIFVSNGPGDPADAPGTADTLRELLGRVPMLGICMGHQLLALALGARTVKLPFGHRGGNHPVLHVTTGKITMSAQNHGYAVDEASLPDGAEVTERSLHDGTVEGFCHAGLRVRGVQYHPEASPGPRDNEYVLAQWIASWQGGRA